MKDFFFCLVVLLLQWLLAPKATLKSTKLFYAKACVEPSANVEMHIDAAWPEHDATEPRKLSRQGTRAGSAVVTAAGVAPCSVVGHHCLRMLPDLLSLEKAFLRTTYAHDSMFSTWVHKSKNLTLFDMSIWFWYVVISVGQNVFLFPVLFSPVTCVPGNGGVRGSLNRNWQTLPGAGWKGSLKATAGNHLHSARVYLVKLVCQQCVNAQSSLAYMCWCFVEDEMSAWILVLCTAHVM